MIRPFDCRLKDIYCKKSRKAQPPVHISGYVLVDATQHTDQRTSKMVCLFFAEALSSGISNENHLS